MKNTIKGFILILSSFFTITYHAQTNPTPFNLNANGNYSFSAWPASSPTGTYPANMIFHLLNATNPTVTAVAQSDLLSGYVYSNTSGTRIQGVGNNGVHFQNATTPVNTGFTANKLGETVLGLVTTSRTQIQINWKAQTKTTAGNVMGIRCQYRIGNSGPYLNFSPMSDFVSSTNLNDSTTFSINLPSGLENQALVQIRWIYYKVSGSTTLSRTIRLDDISVTSLPSVTLSQHPDVCINAVPFVITDGSPSGGVYSGVGVVNGTDFSPAVSGAGTFPLTYTYTDANGISNFATVNIAVSSGACVIPVGLAPGSCGATGLMKYSYIYCEAAAGAQEYQYEFSGGDFPTPIIYTRTNSLTSMNLSWVPQINYGQTYNVRVRAKIMNIWGIFANTCTISMAAVSPVPQLTMASCGATGLSLNSYIYTRPITNTQDYEYTFVNASLNFTTTRLRGGSQTDMNLRWVPGLRYGYTYDVTVRSKVNGVWGAYGPMCQITTQAFPVIQLTPTSCSATNLVKTDRIYCISLAGATNYEYRFTPVPSGTPITRLSNTSTNYLVLSWVTGLLPSTTYDVEVRGYAGGEWGTFGNVCQISTSASYNAITPLAQSSAARMTNETGDSAAAVLMYPNPVSDQTLNLQIAGYNSSDNIAVIDVFDLSGRLTTSEQVTLSPGNTLVNLNVESLESGIYLVNITIGEQRIIQQLVVKK